MKKKNFEYQIDYEIILFGVEPFTNIGSKINNFLIDINKHNLVSKCSWNVIGNKDKHHRLKRFFRYLIKKIKEYRSE